ncbi:MAG: hypothetical protein JWQ73_4388 [Variovorax sp.]|nr:hypothetical protein [Variovorax sp.]
MTMALLASSADAQTIIDNVGVGWGGDASSVAEITQGAGSTQGFLTARVALTAANVFGLTGNTMTAGMQVYNTATVAGAAGVSPGLYTWNGSQWISNSEVPYFHSNSTAVGNSTAANSGATGANSIAIGANATAAGGTSLAAGFGANAAGQDDIAIGRNATAYNASGNPLFGSIAIGQGAQAQNISAVAIGTASVAGWDATAVGRSSSATLRGGAAFGITANASAQYATAIGAIATASGEQSTAVGFQSKAQALSATAVGDGAIAANGADTAVGRSAYASGSLSAALGYSSKATGIGSLAAGAFANAAGTTGIALGYSAEASRQDAIAIGTSANASTYAGVALGSRSVASRAAGTGGAVYVPTSAGATQIAAINATTSTLAAVSVGDAATGIFRQITSVAAGAADSDAVNVSQLKAVSSAVSAIDFPIRSGNAGPYTTAATGKDSLAVGATAAATSGNGTAVGEASRAYSFSTALGYNANASGGNSMALGASSSAIGVRQTVVGSGALADILSTESVVVGTGASATNSAFSTVVGTGASAVGNTNSVFGYQASALNVSNATAIGEGASVTGSAGIAVGSGAAASGNLTTAIGVGAASSGSTGIALGLNAVNTVANSVALGANAFDSATASATTAGTTTYNSSVIAGKTFNYAGGAPIGVVSVGGPGVERRIQNVAAGQVSTTSTDAINGSQLYAVADALTSTVAAGATHYYSVSSTDQSAGSNYANDGATGASSLAAGVGALASGGQTTALGNGATAAVAGGVALGSASVSDRALVPSTGILAAGGFAVPYNTTDRTLLGAVSVGNATSYRQITNVADGTQSQDAVTVRQLTGALQSFAVTPTKYFHANSVAADSLAVGSESVAVGPQTVVNGNNAIGIGNGATVQVSAPGSIAIGQGANTQLADSIALGTNASAAGVQGVALGAGSIVNTAGGVALGAGSVANTAAGAKGYVPTGASTAQTAAVNATTSTLAGVSVGNAATGQLRQINGVAAGSVDSDAVNVSQLKAVQTAVVNIDNNAVKYDTTAAGTTNYNSVNLGNSNSTGPVTLGNVANGVAPTDAVNVQQLNAGVAGANAYTDARVNGLQGNIDGVARKAYAGVASAMALESAPYIAGKTTYAAGVGYYQSQGAIGVALRRTADNGRWSVTGGVSASAGGVAVRAGVSGIWD